jgi:trimeric autotransporter adhesin
MSDFYQQYSLWLNERKPIERRYLKFLARSIVFLSLVTASNSIGLAPLLALPTAPTIKIDNQATGTFTDGDNINAVPESIVSNVVSVTVAEVAGITIFATNTPNPVMGAVTNFDFTIQNIGNDPTKFWLPTAPSSITGGTVTTPLQVVGYIPAGGTQVDFTPIDITTATTTESIGDGTLGTNTTIGSIPPGAAIVVRARVNVTALAGSPVSVTLGDTTGSTIQSNVPYLANTHDVYTVDHLDKSIANEADGQPINGDSINHYQEASFTQTVNAVAPPLKISGTVFEDVNYGGGAGRDLVAASGVPRSNVLVEIYNATGGFLGRTITDPNGLYTFTAANMSAAPLPGIQYQIRVVNSFVTSSRPGGCVPSNSIATPLTPPGSCVQIPVQTFRTKGDVNNDSVADPDTNRIGGEQPAKSDAQFNPNNKSLGYLNAVVSGEAVESLSSVTLGATGMSGIDFGFNFDTIVNINNLKQGSLRQFVTNSNALTNAGLDQVANPNPAPGTTAIDPAPGVETTIFMISASTLPANGVAKILLGVSPIGGRLIITDGFTAIDGRTQTINQGNTNNTILGDITTPIGIGGTTLVGVPGPEIELELSNDVGIYTSGPSTYFHSIAFTGSGGAAIEATTTSINSKIENIIAGTTSAADNQPSTTMAKSVLINGDNTLIDRNLFRSTTESILLNSLNLGTLKDVKITNNEVTSGNAGAALSTGACIHAGTSTNAQSTTNTLIQNNYLHQCAWGVEMTGNSSGVNTTILKNTIDLTKNSGILINSGERNHTIDSNIISHSAGAGIVVERGATGVKITKNSIYRNGSVGIDLSSNSGLYITQGLTPNSGTTDSGFGNDRMNYPVIMSSVVTGTLLRVKGFVGQDTLTSSIFANANLEFFIADDDGNQNGEVFAGDLRNKPHGEGKTYIDSCAANTKGEFDCTFTVAPGFNAKNITATATTTDGTNNTSEFSASPMLRANVLMVKRITAINGNMLENINDKTPLNAFVDDPNSLNENNCSWPGSYPNGTAGQCLNDDYTIGAIDAGQVKPGDVIEYTIYYLNAGENKTFQARICDRLDANSTFEPNFDTINPNKGIVLVANNSTPNYLTNTDTDTDRGQFTTTTLAGASCNLSASTATNQSDDVVVVDIASNSNPLIGSIDQVNSTVSHGYIRFKVKVK